MGLLFKVGKEGVGNVTVRVALLGVRAVGVVGVCKVGVVKPSGISSLGFMFRSGDWRFIISE